MKYNNEIFFSDITHPHPSILRVQRESSNVYDSIHSRRDRPRRCRSIQSVSELLDDDFNSYVLPDTKRFHMPPKRTQLYSNLPVVNHQFVSYKNTQEGHYIKFNNGPNDKPSG